MQKGKGILLGCAALIIAVAVVGLVLSGEFLVTRSIVVQAPAEVVYEQVIDLKKTQAWMPFTKEDPSYKITYGDSTRGVGASYSWAGDSGTGELRIVKSEPHRSIQNEIRSPDMGTTIARWSFESVADGTRVTWQYDGRAPGFVGAYIALIMDPMLGGYFERGLRDLKEISEAAAK